MSTLRAMMLAATLLLFVHATPSRADISPSNMRSGSSSGSGPGGAVLFTVPGGQVFVLTDVTWTAYPFYATTGYGTLVQILNGMGGPPELSWWAFDINTTSPGDHENPVGGHLTTGIVFSQFTPIFVNVGSQAIPGNVTWICSWSGYLAPAGSASVGGGAGGATGLQLSPAPNPSDRKVAVDFRLPAKGSVTLAIFDVKGRRVRTLLHAELAAGAYSIPWDGSDDRGRVVSDGTYFARLETPGSSEVRKVTRLH